jgi:F-type H+-transporting ATPase subunit epsilon
MASAELEVEIVAADHFVWSGPATMVKARTSEGEIGILPGHSPVLALLGEGELAIQPVSGERISWWPSTADSSPSTATVW